MDFAGHIIENQKRLYGYIHSLIGNSTTAWDVLQETNMILWKKQQEFRPGSSFQAWSMATARFQVLAFLRDRKRDPLAVMTPELLESMTATAEAEAACYPERLTALAKCRRELTDKCRQLLDLHYEQGLSMKSIAEQLNQSPSAVKQAIFRTRRVLLDCIQMNSPTGSTD